jgi:hypothetical protein
MAMMNGKRKEKKENRKTGLALLLLAVLLPLGCDLANAVDLKSLAAGKKYYTETAALEEAVTKDNTENAGKFVAGVGIPQSREE